MIGNRRNHAAVFHDQEIIGVFFEPGIHRLTLRLSQSGDYVFNEVEYFDFTPFECQNVVFDIRIYSAANLPEEIKSDFSWVKNYLPIEELLYCMVYSSTGMGGLIVYK